VFTPKDYDATLVMGHVLDEIRAAHDLPRIFDFATHETVPVA
jgi:hypothetical protein